MDAKTGRCWGIRSLPQLFILHFSDPPEYLRVSVTWFSDRLLKVTPCYFSSHERLVINALAAYLKTMFAFSKCPELSVRNVTSSLCESWSEQHLELLPVCVATPRTRSFSVLRTADVVFPDVRD